MDIQIRGSRGIHGTHATRGTLGNQWYGPPQRIYYHTVSWIPTLGLIVDPGTASGLMGSEYLPEFVVGALDPNDTLFAVSERRAFHRHRRW